MEYFYQYLIDAVQDLQAEFGNLYEFAREPWSGDIFVYKKGDCEKYDDPVIQCIIQNEGDKRQWFVVKELSDEYHGKYADVLADGMSATSALLMFLGPTE